jgi:hypothetical protein
MSSPSLRSPIRAANYNTESGIGRDVNLPMLSARNKTNGSSFGLPQDRFAMSASRFNTNRSPSMPMNSTMSSNMPAFRITKTSIPDKGSMKSAYITSDRLNSLMRAPNHKPASEKFNPEYHCKSVAPLTYEDIGQFNNLDLMKTLRSQAPGVSGAGNKNS